MSIESRFEITPNPLLKQVDSLRKQLDQLETGVRGYERSMRLLVGVFQELAKDQATYAKMLEIHERLEIKTT